MTGRLDDNDLENSYEMHVIINVKSGRALRFAGNEDIKYADGLNVEEGFTMLVRLTEDRYFIISLPFIFFSNKY